MGRYSPDCCYRCGIELGAEVARVCEDCRANLGADGMSAFLAREVSRYLDKPGCNVPSRQQAMERLRWALDKSKEKES